MVYIFRNAFQSIAKPTIHYNLTCTHAKKRSILLRSKCIDNVCDEPTEIKKTKPKSQCSMTRGNEKRKYETLNKPTPGYIYHKYIGPRNVTSIDRPTPRPMGSYNNEPHAHAISISPVKQNYKYNYYMGHEEKPKVQVLLDYKVQGRTRAYNGDMNSYTEIFPLPNTSHRATDNTGRVKSNNTSKLNDRLVLPKCKQAFVPLPSCGVSSWNQIKHNFKTNAIKNTIKENNSLLKPNVSFRFKKR